MGGCVDLFGGEPATAYRHAVPVRDSADRPPLDAEPGGQFVHGRFGLVPGNEFLDLIDVELLCPPLVPATSEGIGLVGLAASGVELRGVLDDPHTRREGRESTAPSLRVTNSAHRGCLFVVPGSTVREQ